MHQPMWDSTTSPTSHNQTTKPGRVGTLETHPHFWIEQNKTRIGQTSFIKPNQTPYSTYPITIPDPRTPDLFLHSNPSVVFLFFARVKPQTVKPNPPLSFRTLLHSVKAWHRPKWPFLLDPKGLDLKGFWPLNLEVIWVLGKYIYIYLLNIYIYIHI